MKPEILNNDHMMFLDRALDTQRTALLTAMADAVAECRTAADQAAELTETGEIGLLRLVEILCAAKVQRGQSGGAVLEGTEVQILADALAQLYACLTECRFVGPLGLAAYAELSSMAASLMLGEWFDSVSYTHLRPSVLEKLAQFKELVKSAVVDRAHRKEPER